MNEAKKAEFVREVNAFTRMEGNTRGPRNLMVAVTLGVTRTLRQSADILGEPSTAVPKHIIAEPMYEERVASLARLDEAVLGRLIRAEPPVVSRVMLPDGDCVFAVTIDGNHRTTAATLKGIRSMDVIVYNEVGDLRGKTFVVSDGVLYRVKGGIFTRLLESSRLPQNMMNEALRKVLEFKGANVSVSASVDPSRMDPFQPTSYLALAELRQS